MCQPYPITKISDADVAWQNDVLGVSRVIRFPLGDTAAELRFRDPGDIEVDRWAQLAAGSVTFWVGLADWDLLPAAGDFLDGGLLSRLPAEILPAVVETLFEQPLDWLSQKLSSRCEIVAVSADGSNDMPRIGLTLTADTGEAASGLIAGDHSAMKSLRDLILTAPVNPALDLDALPLAAVVEIGRTQLPLDRMAQLKIHDVVLIDETSFPDDQQGVIQFSPAHRWRVAMEGDKVTLSERREPEPPGRTAGDGATASVVIELGRVAITASELEALEPGRVMHTTSSDRIILSSRGRPFARGELVQVGPRYGVRLLSRAISHPDGDDEPTSLIK